MKTFLSYIAVVALIITSSFTVNQQKQLNQRTTSCFSHFTAHRAGKSAIELTWSVSSTDIVQFSIERSYDGDFFENINSANFNGSASYKYKDAGVYPGNIYYRITAVKADGSTECSSVEMVRIVQRG